MASPLSLEVRDTFGEPRRMKATRMRLFFEARKCALLPSERKCAHPGMTNVCGGRKWNHLPSRGLLSRNWENNHGTKIFEESISQGQARDERAQGRDSEERSIRSQGQEPQAGDRDRSFRGEGGRQEGPEEGLEKKEELQEAEVEKIAHSKLISSWPGLTRPSTSFFLMRR